MSGTWVQYETKLGDCETVGVHAHAHSHWTNLDEQLGAK